MFHRFFPSGIGDIFPFDRTALQNPAAVLDVFKGAFRVGMQYISTYESESDVIRVTGYLIKRSDFEPCKRRAGRQRRGRRLQGNDRGTRHLQTDGAQRLKAAPGRIPGK